MRVGICRYVNDGNSWNMSSGVVNTFKRMGHEVLDAVLEWEQWPTPEWNALDFLLILEADHYHRPERWDWLKIPKVLWYTETARRVDLHFEDRYEGHKAYTPYRFFVAKQDAEEYDGGWMPHGVDLEMYRPLGIAKDVNLGFFGHIYEKRQPFWRKIQEAGIAIHQFNRRGGSREEQFRCLVEDINRSRVIVALPAYSHSFTTRPLECMACGVPVVVPYLESFARVNEAQWKYPPCYYDENDMLSLRQTIARAGMQNPFDLMAEARRHSTEAKCQRIIDTVTGKRAVRDDTID